MENAKTNVQPGDASLVEEIVNQLKSQGIFDQWRKDCLADVDTKPAYQNLQQRVESTVARFLEKQYWNEKLNKNQLRERLRKHILGAGFLDKGLDRITDQVVDPKVNRVFLPVIKDTVYSHLGLENPDKKVDNASKPLLNLNMQPPGAGQQPGLFHLPNYTEEKKEEPVSDTEMAVESSSSTSSSPTPPAYSPIGGGLPSPRSDSSPMRISPENITSSPSLPSPVNPTMPPPPPVESDSEASSMDISYSPDAHNEGGRRVGDIAQEGAAVVEEMMARVPSPRAVNPSTSALSQISSGDSLPAEPSPPGDATPLLDETSQPEFSEPPAPPLATEKEVPPPPPPSEAEGAPPPPEPPAVEAPPPLPPAEGPSPPLPPEADPPAPPTEPAPAPPPEEEPAPPGTEVVSPPPEDDCPPKPSEGKPQPPKETSTEAQDLTPSPPSGIQSPEPTVQKQSSPSEDSDIEVRVMNVSANVRKMDLREVVTISPDSVSSVSLVESSPSPPRGPPPKPTLESMLSDISDSPEESLKKSPSDEGEIESDREKRKKEAKRNSKKGKGESDSGEISDSSPEVHRGSKKKERRPSTSSSSTSSSSESSSEDDRRRRPHDRDRDRGRDRDDYSRRGSGSYDRKDGGGRGDYQRGSYYGSSGKDYYRSDVKGRQMAVEEKTEQDAESPGSSKENITPERNEKQEKKNILSEKVVDEILSTVETLQKEVTVGLLVEKKEAETDSANKEVELTLKKEEVSVMNVSCEPKEEELNVLKDVAIEVTKKDEKIKDDKKHSSRHDSRRSDKGSRHSSSHKDSSRSSERRNDDTGRSDSRKHSSDRHRESSKRSESSEKKHSSSDRRKSPSKRSDDRHREKSDSRDRRDESKSSKEKSKDHRSRSSDTKSKSSSSRGGERSSSHGSKSISGADGKSKREEKSTVVRKPKIADNFEEMRKVMKERKKLKEQEKAAEKAGVAASNSDAETPVETEKKVLVECESNEKELDKEPTSSVPSEPEADNVKSKEVESNKSDEIKETESVSAPSRQPAADVSKSVDVKETESVSAQPRQSATDVSNVEIPDRAKLIQLAMRPPVGSKTVRDFLRGKSDEEVLSLLPDDPVMEDKHQEGDSVVPALDLYDFEEYRTWGKKTWMTIRIDDKTYSLRVANVNKAIHPLDLMKVQPNSTEEPSGKRVRKANARFISEDYLDGSSSPARTKKPKSPVGGSTPRSEVSDSDLEDKGRKRKHSGTPREKPEKKLKPDPGDILDSLPDVEIGEKKDSTSGCEGGNSKPVDGKRNFESQFEAFVAKKSACETASSVNSEKCPSSKKQKLIEQKKSHKKTAPVAEPQKGHRKDQGASNVVPAPDRPHKKKVSVAPLAEPQKESGSSESTSAPGSHKKKPPVTPIGEPQNVKQSNTPASSCSQIEKTKTPLQTEASAAKIGILDLPVEQEGKRVRKLNMKYGDDYLMVPKSYKEAGEERLKAVGTEDDDYCPSGKKAAKRRDSVPDQTDVCPRSTPKRQCSESSDSESTKQELSSVFCVKKPTVMIPKPRTVTPKTSPTHDETMSPRMDSPSESAIAVDPLRGATEKIESTISPESEQTTESLKIQEAEASQSRRNEENRKFDGKVVEETAKSVAATSPTRRGRPRKSGNEPAEVPALGTRMSPAKGTETSAKKRGSSPKKQEIDVPSRADTRNRKSVASESEVSETPARSRRGKNAVEVETADKVVDSKTPRAVREQKTASSGNKPRAKSPRKANDADVETGVKTPRLTQQQKSETKSAQGRSSRKSAKAEAKVETPNEANTPRTSTRRKSNSTSVEDVKTPVAKQKSETTKSKQQPSADESATSIRAKKKSETESAVKTNKKSPKRKAESESSETGDFTPPREDSPPESPVKSKSSRKMAGANGGNSVRENTPPDSDSERKGTKRKAGEHETSSTRSSDPSAKNADTPAAKKRKLSVEPKKRYDASDLYKPRQTTRTSRRTSRSIASDEEGEIATK